jgi:hypothetical protein
VCVCVNSQHRQVQYYVLRRELIANLCLVLHQRKEREDEEVQTFGKNKYQIHNTILQFVVVYFKARNQMLL